MLVTGQQRLIVLRTWHKLSVDMSMLGISTMSKLLEIDPAIRNTFPFRKKQGQELQVNPNFRQHAFWLIQAINAVVENLDELDPTVNDMFFEIGEKHAYIPGFVVNMFWTVQAAWAYVWEDQLRERYTIQTEKSWAKIFKHVVAVLSKGYEHATVDDIHILPQISPARNVVSATMTAPTSSGLLHGESDIDSPEDGQGEENGVDLPDAPQVPTESGTVNVFSTMTIHEKGEKNPGKGSFLRIKSHAEDMRAFRDSTLSPGPSGKARPTRSVIERSVTGIEVSFRLDRPRSASLDPRHIK